MAGWEKIITEGDDASYKNSNTTVNNSSWSGTDLSVANGGTGASSSSTARNNLGLGTNSDVEFNNCELGGELIVNDNFTLYGDMFLADPSGNRDSLGLGSSDNVTHNNMTVNGTLDASANNSLTGWHTKDKIFVSPEEFSPNDHQNYGNVAMHSSGGSARMTYSAIEGYANVMIPSGYKVTHFRINGTSSVNISAHSSTCATSTETSVSPPSSLYTNSTYQTNPTTGILADDTNGKYFILGWLPTTTSKYLYGAILTIAKI